MANAISSTVGDEEIIDCAMCGLSATEGDPDYLTFNFICVVVILPVLAACGVVGNILTVFVFTRREIRESSASAVNHFLTALAFCDISLLGTAIFMFTFENLRHTQPKIRDLFLSCVQYVYPMAMLCQTCSIYITVSAAICCFLEVWTFKQHRKSLSVNGVGQKSIIAPRHFFCCFHRCLCTCHAPTLECRCQCGERGLRRRVAHFSRTTKSLFAIGAVILFSVVYNLPHFFEVSVRPCLQSETNQTRLEVCATELRRNDQYNKIYYLYLYTSVMTVGPIVLLSVLNVLIIYKVSQLRRIRSRRESSMTALVSSTLANGYAATEGDTRKFLATSIPNTLSEEGEDPITLIVVVLLFIFCNTLGLVVNFLELFLPDLGSMVNYLIDVSNVLVALNSSVNFIIYVSFGEKFREIILRTFFNH